MKTLACVVFLAASALFSWLGIRSYLSYAKKKQILDVPNERSSHTLPTPRGAGLAFATAFFVGVALLQFFRLLQLNELFAIMAGALVVAIGYWDDCVGLSIRIRLTVQLSAAVFMAAALSHFQLPANQPSLFGILVLILIEILGIIWLLNLTNFMDGIDGIVTIEIVTVTLVCAVVIIIERGLTPTAFLFALLGASVAPFLFFNWSPARIFMGDAGSCFIGFTFGVISLIATSHHELSLFCPLILFGVFICDATNTLLVRIFTGQRWYEPHRTHAFQILSGHFGHSSVSSSVAILNLIWLAPIAVLAELDQEHGIIYTLIAFAPLIVTCRMLDAGNARSAPWPVHSSRLVLAVPANGASDPYLLSSDAILHRLFPLFQMTLMAVLSVVCALVTMLLNFEQYHLHEVSGMLLPIALLWGTCQSFILLCFRLHRRHWRFTSVEELPALAGGTLLGSILGGLAVAVFARVHHIFIPKPVYPLEAALSVLALCGLRIFVGHFSQQRQRTMAKLDQEPVLIFRADIAGISMLTQLRLHHPEFHPIGFIDERPEVHGVSICGLRVLGHHEDLRAIVRKYSVHHIFISQKLQSDYFITEAIKRACISENVGVHIVFPTAIISMDAA